MSLTSKSNRNAKKFRVVFLGDQSVGKTSIIERYSSGRFDENYNSTVGIDFNVRDITRNGNLYRLQMWDTAGQERYRSLIPTYLKNAHCVVFVYDVTKTKSLDNLSDWYKLFAEYQEAPGIVVGNKTDLTAARKIDRLEGEKFSSTHKLHYTEVSAKTGKKINQLFDFVLDTIIETEKTELFEENQKGQSNNDMRVVNLQEFDKVKLQKKQSWSGQLSQRCCPEG